MQDFRRLKVWEKAHLLAVDIFRVTERMRARYGASLVSQLRRAALSIPANIAEGAGKQTSAEFQRFLQIALGSASETLYHLLLARDIGALPSAEYDDLSVRVVEVRRMLCGLARRVDARNPAPATPLQRTRESHEPALRNVSHRPLTSDR
jgi:four helix bundle protein